MFLIVSPDMPWHWIYGMDLNGSVITPFGRAHPECGHGRPSWRKAAGSPTLPVRLRHRRRPSARSLAAFLRGAQALCEGSPCEALTAKRRQLCHGLTVSIRRAHLKIVKVVAQ